MEGFRHTNPSSAYSHHINASATSQSGIQQFSPRVIPPQSSKKRGFGSYITKNFELHIRRLLPGSHTLEKAAKSKNLCLFCPFLSKTSSSHQYLMTLKAQKAVYTILVFSVLYIRFLYAKTFCMRLYHDPRFIWENRRLGRLILFLFLDWSLY